MKKTLFLLILCSFLGGVDLLAQSLRDVVKNPITKEYFLEPLREEVKKESPYTEPEFTEKNIQEALRRAYKDCNECFDVKGGSYYSAIDIERQKSLAANNSFNIDFKEFISVGDFRLYEYARDFIGTYGGEPRSKDFKTFKSYHSSILKEAGVKKKTDQENLYNNLLKKREELGKKLVQLYGNYDYKMQLLKAFGEKYPELYKTSYYPSPESKKLIIEKIAPHFNPLDNLLFYPEYTAKENTEAENEELKKMLLDTGWVEVVEWSEPSSDGFTFIFPKLNDALEKRTNVLNKYFRLENTRRARYYFAKRRILELWYGNLGNEFALQNFLTVCGDNVPSKEDFLANGDEFKDLIELYVDELLNGPRLKGNFTYSDQTFLFQNVVSNHYGIQSDDLKNVRKQQSILKEKEESEKGGLLRSKIFYKINSQGKFERLHFLSNLSLGRSVNQSEYWGKYEKKSGNIYKMTLKDLKTGIQLPEFEGRLSSDQKKLYLGEDKVPYILSGSNDPNCLEDKKDIWYSADGKESFSTAYGGATWKSSITGGISANGSLYKISNSKYAFVIYENSWGGKLENNLVTITISDNCNTIYYGKGKKKMVIE